MNRQDEMREQVAEFHRQHPEVWRLFVRFTFQMIERGYRNYSAKAIFERIRWEKDAGGDGVTCFKLNNNCTAFYARRFAKVYPEHAEFFRTRQQPSAAELPSRRPQLTPAHYQ